MRSASQRNRHLCHPLSLTRWPLRCDRRFRSDCSLIFRQEAQLMIEMDLQWVTLHIHTYWIILGYCLTNIGPIYGVLYGIMKTVNPPNANGLSSPVDRLRTWRGPIFGQTLRMHPWSVFTLPWSEFCSPDARHCGTTQVLSFSVEDSWGAQKQSPKKTARQVHAYMVPNMQKNGCLCVYLIVHIYMYMVFGIRRYNYPLVV